MPLRRNINPSAAVLWASAFVLIALVIIQAGRLPGNPAYAGMSVADHGFTLMTSRSGRGNPADPYELLYILDSRGEVMMIYEIENALNKQILLRDGHSLPDWFRTARR